MERRSTDLLVLGAGVAGVYAALAAEERGARVLLVSKDPLPAGSTPWAQGGVAFPVGEEDLGPTSGTPSWPAGASWRKGWPAPSWRRPPPPGEASRLRPSLPPRAHPGRGHSRARVFHLGGDRSGLLLIEGLLKRLSTPVVPAQALSLLVSGNRVAGALLWGPGGLWEVRAGAVLLATGGFGRLFPVTTNPHGATGDGMALAWRAGAVLRDLEFVQFHPTALPNGALVSEACRGRGPSS